MIEPMTNTDREQNEKIVWCERLLYLIVLLQFPQLATMI